MHTHCNNIKLIIYCAFIIVTCHQIFSVNVHAQSQTNYFPLKLGDSIKYEWYYTKITKSAFTGTKKDSLFGIAYLRTIAKNDSILTLTLESDTLNSAWSIDTVRCSYRAGTSENSHGTFLNHSGTVRHVIFSDTYNSNSTFLLPSLFDGRTITSQVIDTMIDVPSNGNVASIRIVNRYYTTNGQQELTILSTEEYGKDVGLISLGYYIEDASLITYTINESTFSWKLPKTVKTDDAPPVANKIGISILPNPVNSYAVLSVCGKPSERWSVYVVDMLGRVVIMQSSGSAATGSTIVSLDCSMLRSGRYSCIVQSGASTAISPLIVVR